jgi:hypothetical protein
VESKGRIKEQRCGNACPLVEAMVIRKKHKSLLLTNKEKKGKDLFFGGEGIRMLDARFG